MMDPIQSSSLSADEFTRQMLRVDSLEDLENASAEQFMNLLSEKTSPQYEPIPTFLVESAVTPEPKSAGKAKKLKIDQLALKLHSQPPPEESSVIELSPTEESTLELSTAGEDSGISEEPSPDLGLLDCKISHIKMDDKRERPFVCDICGMAFTQKGNLTRHKHIHAPTKPFKCELCPYATRRKDALVNHQSTHFCEKPFTCADCGETYKQKTSLRNHLRTVHEMSNDQINQRIPNTPFQLTQIKPTNGLLKRKHDDSSEYPAMSPSPTSPVSVDSDSNLVKPEPKSEIEEILNFSASRAEIENSVKKTVAVSETKSEPMNGLDLSQKSTPVKSTPQAIAPSPMQIPAQAQELYIANMMRQRALWQQWYHNQQQQQQISGNNPSLPPPLSAFNQQAAAAAITANIVNRLPAPKQEPVQKQESNKCDWCKKHSTVHQCKVCETLFSDEGMLRIHMSIHGANNPLQCSQCDFIAANKYEFYAHVTTGKHVNST